MTEVWVPPDWHPKKPLPNTCPFCGATPCIPAWRKMALGPGGGTPCRTCGFKVGISIPHYVAAMGPAVLLIGLVQATLLRSVFLAITLIPAAFVVGTIAHLVWVPLAQAQFFFPSLVEERVGRILPPIPDTPVGYAFQSRYAELVGASQLDLYRWTIALWPKDYPKYRARVQAVVDATGGHPALFLPDVPPQRGDADAGGANPGSAGSGGPQPPTAPRRYYLAEFEAGLAADRIWSRPRGLAAGQGQFGYGSNPGETRLVLPSRA